MSFPIRGYDIVGLGWALESIYLKSLCFQNVPHQCRDENHISYRLISGLPLYSAGKESACCAGDLGSIPGLGRSPGEGKGYPLQYSGLENSRECVDYEVAKSWTPLSDFHFHIG